MKNTLFNCISVKAYRSKMLGYIMLQLLKYGLVLAPPYCYLLFLNEVITDRKLEKLWLILLLYIAVYLAKAFVSVLIKRSYNGIFPEMKKNLKGCVLEKYSDLDIGVLQSYTAGELKERLHRDTENAVLFLEKTLEIGMSAAGILITIGILLYLNWILAAVSFLLLPVSFLMTRYIKGRSNVEYERKRRILGVYNDFMIHNMFFWKEIKVNRLEETQKEHFADLWGDMGDAFLKAHICWFLNRSFLAFKDVFLTKMGLYLLGGILVIYQMATVPVLLTFMEYYADFANRLLELADIIMKRGEQEESIRRIEEMMKLPLEQRRCEVEAFEQLEFRSVDFTYAESQGEILRDFNMDVHRGEKIAIVGESGCGKSTLIKMMAGCLIPDRGSILWNGISMDQIDRKTIYAKVGFLMQESSLFNLTIRENLLFGRADASEAEMRDACTRANIMELIRRLPEGFDTIIGENGIRLSGGQRQRLVIARLFLQNPEVIVFDEATSALDYQNESEILNLLLRNMGEKTFMMVTHRGTSVARCDRVLRMTKER